MLKEALRERIQYRLGSLASNHTWALQVCDVCEVGQFDVCAIVHVRIGFTDFTRLPKGSVTQQITTQDGTDCCWDGETGWVEDRCGRFIFHWMPFFFCLNV